LQKVEIMVQVRVINHIVVQQIQNFTLCA